MRLFGESPYRGRVEICKGSVWGSVCSWYGISNSDATVICRMLGYQPDYTIGEINVQPSLYCNNVMLWDVQYSFTSQKVHHMLLNWAAVIYNEHILILATEKVV